MPKEDPHQVVAARRRVEQNQVRRWTLKVEHDLRDLESRRASRNERYRVPAGFEERELEREVELRSLHELLGRGLDPNRSRVFNGRSLLVVRCKGKGHCLARVYATSYRPVFVPQNADFPAGQTKETRFAHLESSKMLKKHFPEVRLRDNWIEEYPDESLRGELLERERGLAPQPPKERMAEIDIATTDFDIRGMTVIRPHHGEKEVAWEGVQVQPSWYLTCRCGTRLLASWLVVEALKVGTQQVFA